VIHGPLDRNRTCI